nr:uncharacterized protein LOC105872110 [Microcebus murinus]
MNPLENLPEEAYASVPHTPPPPRLIELVSGGVWAQVFILKLPAHHPRDRQQMRRRLGLPALPWVAKGAFGAATAAARAGVGSSSESRTGQGRPARRWGRLAGGVRRGQRSRAARSRLTLPPALPTPISQTAPRAAAATQIPVPSSVPLPATLALACRGGPSAPRRSHADTTDTSMYSGKLKSAVDYIEIKYLEQMGSCYVFQAGLKLLASSNPPTSAS